MLNIDLKENEGTVTVVMEGMLDAQSAGAFRDRLGEIPEGCGKVIIDMEKLRYTSSAGLRVILGLQNRIDETGGSLVFKNVNSMIMEVFDDTGFSDILTIE